MEWLGADNFINYCAKSDTHEHDDLDDVIIGAHRSFTKLHGIFYKKCLGLKNGSEFLAMFDSEIEEFEKR